MPIATSDAQFDPVYWASKSPAILGLVKAIKSIPTEQGTGARLALAIDTANALIADGRTGPADLVDNPIMVWLWSPFFVMQSLIAQGKMATPDGTGKYPIKVSLDLEDYPAYTPLPVPPPNPGAQP
jgi:hypothetical protein